MVQGVWHFAARCCAPARDGASRKYVLKSGPLASDSWESAFCCCLKPKPGTAARQQPLAIAPEDEQYAGNSYTHVIPKAQVSLSGVNSAESLVVADDPSDLGDESFVGVVSLRDVHVAWSVVCNSVGDAPENSS